MAYGLPENIDPNHRYTYRSGLYGVYDYWYKDNFGNYWLYTNAPKGHPHFDEYGAEAILVDNQPMPHTAPQFYTTDGMKLSSPKPEGVQLTMNEAYSEEIPSSIWYAMFTSKSGESRFLYLDKDVRENLDLWVQYQLRIADVGVIPMRSYAVRLFQSKHSKDRLVALILMLVDQGMFLPEELITATVGDVVYTDRSVKLLGKKLSVDPLVLDVLTSLTLQRDSSEPLFVLDSNFGRHAIGLRHIYSIFKGLRLPYKFLRYWHVSNMYTRIMHRLAVAGANADEADDLAQQEVQKALTTVSDVSSYIDHKIRSHIMSTFSILQDQAQEGQAQEGQAQEGQAQEGQAQEGQAVQKSLLLVDADDFGTLLVLSSLGEKTPDEFEFSQWLHSTPLHHEGGTNV